MQAAVSYGFVFGCDPMTFLDRPERDIPALMALLDIAVERRKGASNG